MWIRVLGSTATIVLLCITVSRSQDLPAITTVGETNAQSGSDVPQGVEVQARGPIHEAFATPTAEPKPTYGVPKKPPAPIEEMPPDEKPEGDPVWIGGYWAWDDDRADYLWVSGCWRVPPQGKDWVAGYWREVSGQHQWVPGFWRTVETNQASDVTYYPEPPPPPQIAPPPPPADPDQFYVPGYWMWTGDHYVWRAGYHTRVRPGYVYVASHYRWTPFGFVFVAGYWDYAIARRGVLYAPVYVNAVVVGPRFVYTPYYAVSDTILVDAYFVRPGFCHYYYGDYYGPRYASVGFVCGYHYSRSHYDAVVVYNRWEYRNSPGWYDTRVSITIARNAGRAPLPPRTLVQQNNITIVNNKTTNVYNTKVIAPTKTVVASRGAKTVALDSSARLQAKESATTVQRAAITQRLKTESAPQGQGAPAKPRTASLNLPQSPAAKKHLAETGSGLKTTPKAVTTTLPKNLDKPGPAHTKPLTTKGPGTPQSNKAKPPGTLGKGIQPVNTGSPKIARPSIGADRPAATKSPPPEKTKKGG